MLPPTELRARVEDEFATAVRLLRDAGVVVDVAEDTATPPKPDAIFPNNWVSTHDDGTVVLYPMAAASRRIERRPELLRALPGCRIGAWIDLAPLEARGACLEGTGSLVLDRVRRVAYACLSPRTTPAGLAAFAERTGFEVVAFRATDAEGRAIYHTNVMLSLGGQIGIVCLESIEDAGDRAMLRRRLAAACTLLVVISREQMARFAANVLELTTPGGPLLVLSVTAHDALAPAQRQELAGHCRMLPIPIPTVERVGGGSLRCMLAENFLPAP